MRFNPIIVKTGGTTPTPTEWVRPSDWITIPSVSTGEEVVYILAKVNEFGANYCALQMKGNYTVDWGDGVVENFNSSVIAYHSYDYATCGNLSTLGYKQALIKVTPQAGQTLNYVNISLAYTGIAAGKSSIFLDVVMNIPNVAGATNLYIGNASGVYHWIVERIWIKEIGLITTMANMFYSCHSLQSVPLFNTINVTTMYHMFMNCVSLQSVPLFNTINVTTMYQMFYSCNSLQSVPLFNTTNVTTMAYMFCYCYSLQSVPLFNTINVTTMANMFYNCNSLQSVPLFNTINVTTMYQMFTYCVSLQSVPLFNTINVTTMYQMFTYCVSLQSVPLFNTTNVTDYTQILVNAGSVTSIGFTNIKSNISVASQMLIATELNKIFENLVDLTGSTAKSITITSNIGSATCNTSLATAKNWTVIN